MNKDVLIVALTALGALCAAGVAHAQVAGSTTAKKLSITGSTPPDDHGEGRPATDGLAR